MPGIKCDKCKKDIEFSAVGPDAATVGTMSRRTVLTTRIGGEPVGYATARDVIEGHVGKIEVDVLCVTCNTPNVAEAAKGAGLYGRHLEALEANAKRHGATPAICRAIADVLHDARPFGSDRGEEAWKRMSSAHATARRLAEILAAPR